ncbi:unnamed protein product [Eruca vesicaria subsp. sativa]|uniref:GH16 domain-containing protein n=1 Tax=Eruca vesicaria subsp. sativa TaxID=29727 RepID=A0ABC8KZG2_ERUVS|nr:unnamed protein product [Eruca vesicaria subsp. sativa]
MVLIQDELTAQVNHRGTEPAAAKRRLNNQANFAGDTAGSRNRETEKMIATNDRRESQPAAGSFHKDVQIHWGDSRGKIRDRDGKVLSLSLDKSSGSGFQSNQEFLYGKVEVQMKLVPRNMLVFYDDFVYLKSPGTTWDEIDFEFLGNISGHPYTLHTNVYTQGSGDKEQQFHLWLTQPLIFTLIASHGIHKGLFDGIPIREFKNTESMGVPFPKNQPMRLYASLWEAEHWATRGGLEKTDWSKAPFSALYRNYNVEGCVWANGKSSCPGNSPWFTQKVVLECQKKNEMGTE